MTPAPIQQEYKPKCRKVKFSDEEDRQILALVSAAGENVNWELVSFALGNRTSRQCKDRYHAYLQPGLNKSEWTEQEDQQLIDMVAQFGQKWKFIATSFKGRPEVSLKNRYRLLQRRSAKIQRALQPMASSEFMNQPQQESIMTDVSSPESKNSEKIDVEDNPFDFAFSDNFGFDDAFNFY
ncbi:RNA polymerase II transcription regulator recruiting protein [Trichomonas vaginalis G3]|uniref:RNA polymerase II transcription regulator recruiting protein n=1 Tax=Trichomonas vaginalis (strain ATCC PRA-98 / G3) TaxID=412133 RepID=UPI0021E58680|nr:RNA polymerase II transcription regulator recruiting protein [Trichomonas vaginalis G3]KAI5507863.1 RNA polymerase II transcription regulator recruiting protein [Trichomonas vaginalis G3]